MTAHKKEEKIEEKEEAPTASPNQVKTLLAWTAPGRPFAKKGKQYYTSALLIALLIEFILFLFSQYVLMAVVASLVFLSFALASVPPRNFHYRVSSEGITVEDHFFLWQELYDFYFKRVDGEDILHIRTHAFIPSELTITMGDMHREHVKEVLLYFLPFREFIKPTFIEKAGDWLARNFPLENK
ncbi:hypothetical protein KKG52_00785 [Patescibacteria group bacterium]|nr:hypothetical protein [Patescibacteria group bacterium]